MRIRFVKFLKQLKHPEEKRLNEMNSTHIPFMNTTPN